MSMKLDLGKVFFFILLLVLSTMTAMAGNIKGTVLDKQTKEPLTGATIQITGTAQGVVADIDGNYTLNVNDHNREIYRIQRHPAQQHKSQGRNFAEL